MRVVRTQRGDGSQVACKGMSHRFSTWWRALSVVLLSLATVTWPSAAHAETTSHIEFIHQDAVATLSKEGTSHFSTTIRIPESSSAHGDVTLYPRIVERSQLAPIINGVGLTGRGISTTGPIDFSCNSGTEIRFDVDIFSRRVRPSVHRCTTGTPRLHVACGGAGCDGVYPLRYVITSGSTTRTIWTLLTVQQTRGVTPLRVALVETLGAVAARQPKRTASNLAALAHLGLTPVTLAVDYRALNDIIDAGTTTPYRSALSAALSTPLHRAIDAPLGSVDFGGLRAHQLESEVRFQLSFPGGLLSTLTGHSLDAQAVISDRPSLTSLRALNAAGVKDVIVPESDLPIPPSATLTWGAPFHVAGTTSMVALSTDGPLSTLVADSRIEPGLRSVLTLGTLDFLHFEAPFAPSVRTVVIAAPASALDGAFITNLANGLDADPYTLPSNLASSYAPGLIGSNGAPGTRTLIPPSGTSTWSSTNVNSLNRTIDLVSSYANAVTSSNVGNTLREDVLTSELVGSPDERQSAISATDQALVKEVGNFSIDQNSITLTGSSATIPITVFSHAPYTVTAVVHLMAPGLTFPKGADQPVVLNSPTKSIEVPTSSRAGNNLTLQVLLTTPDGRLVLANAAIQLRVAGSSLVGYLLTFASLIVLGLWWLRTIRRRSAEKGRHAR